MSSFQERQKDLFNHLKNAERECNFIKEEDTKTPQDYGVIDKETYKRVKCEMKRFKGKESLYKRSDGNRRPNLRPKHIPDFMKNPKKWTYYSLSDVTPEQMSDATNTATALALIRELEDRNAMNSEKEQRNEDDNFKKPAFRVSAAYKKRLETEPEKPIFKDRKVLMPEYVVGVTQKKEKKNKIVPKEIEVKKVELKLNHLYEEEDLSST